FRSRGSTHSAGRVTTGSSCSRRTPACRRFAPKCRWTAIRCGRRRACRMPWVASRSGDCARWRSRPWARNSTSRRFTTGCSRTARCRCRCCATRSSAGSLRRVSGSHGHPPRLQCRHLVRRPPRRRRPRQPARRPVRRQGHHLRRRAGRAGPGQMGLSELVTAESGELDPAATTKDDVAFWLYTSGTTGTPKAAVHLHHDMVVCCEAFGRHVLEIGPEDRCFSVARLFFAYGLGNALYFPFHVGAATVLDSRRPEPVKVFEILTRERPTLFFAVPTAFAAMLQVVDAERLYDLRSVRLCLSAGEPLPKPIYERWRERFGLEILDGIGSTEMCHTFIANRRGTVCPGSSGTLVPGYEAMVVDDAGR